MGLQNRQVLNRASHDFRHLGMTANVDIVVASAEDALLVPNRAIEADREAGCFYVTRRRAQGATERVEVLIGLRDESHTQILEGLEEGDRYSSAPSSPSSRPTTGPTPWSRPCATAWSSCGRGIPSNRFLAKIALLAGNRLNPEALPGMPRPYETSIWPQANCLCHAT